MNDIDASSPHQRMVRRAPTPWDRDPRRYQRRRRALETSLAWGVPTVLILMWQWAASSGSIDTRFFPAPTTIWSETGEMIDDGSLWHHTYLSSRRVIQGFTLGVVSGCATGLALALSRTLRAALEPLLSALYTVPKLALLPLLLLIFGLGETPIILLIAITVFFFMWISTMAAVTSVPVGHREAIESFGAKRRHVFRHVLGPAAIPQLFVAMRLSAGIAVLVVVAAEFVQGNDGIGNVIWKSWSLFRADRMYVGIVVVALMGLVFMQTISWLGRLAAPWAPNDHSVGGPH